MAFNSGLFLSLLWSAISLFETDFEKKKKLVNDINVLINSRNYSLMFNESDLSECEKYDSHEAVYEKCYNDLLCCDNSENNDVDSQPEAQNQLIDVGQSPEQIQQYSSIKVSSSEQQGEKKRPGKQGLHGEIYQLKLLMLF